MLLFSLLPSIILSQINIDFENGFIGDWEQFPENRWETSGVGSLSGTKSLHHSFDNNVAGTDFISLKTGIINPDSLISWDFIIKHGYLPSSSNRWLIILLSDKPADKMADNASVNAYGIGVNVNSSDDSLRFYYFKDGIPVSAKSLGVNYEKDIGTNPFRFHICRDTLGFMEFYGSSSDSVLRQLCGFIFSGEVNFTGRYFGLQYTYSSTRDRLLWLDNLVIEADLIIDTIAPLIINSKTPSDRSIKIVFSEEVDTSSFFIENVYLNPGEIHPDSFMLAGNELNVFFNNSFLQGQSYSFKIYGISDKEGNIADSLVANFIWYEAEMYDLIISEIMADPQPVVYLPEFEFIEIYNRSNFTINLDSFTIITGLKNWVLPECSLNSGEYLIITNREAFELFPANRTIAIFTSASTITNEGQELSITDRKGRIISAVKFDKTWYNDGFKTDGGWSLERVDINNVCGESDNFKASQDLTGGTPGRENSVTSINTDITAPEVDRIVFLEKNKIELDFTESIAPNSLPEFSFFRLHENNMIPDSVILIPPFYKSVTIIYPDSLKDGRIYSFIQPETLSDCSGNNFKAGQLIRFGIPMVCRYSDVLISEVLFAPSVGCPEFIELFNATDHLLELTDIKIINSLNGTGTLQNICTKPLLFFPGEYLAITKDKKGLMNFFDINFPERIIESKDLPSFSNEGGCIKILNKSLETIDEYCYSPKDQFFLLSDQSGVSMERVKMDNVPGSEALWHSASSLAGFATPGYENSQKLTVNQDNNDFEIKPDVFTPDNDGKDDIMTFSYCFEKEGYSGNVCIFDPTGRLVKYLGRNELLGTGGSLYWDGRNETGKLCKLGIYLIYMEAFHPSGKVKKFKGTIVLAKYKF